VKYFLLKYQFFFFGGTGVWTQGFIFAKQALYFSTQLQYIFILWLLLEMGVSWTICLGWSQTMILSISAFQLARIIGMSHGYLAKIQVFFFFLNLPLLPNQHLLRNYTVQGFYIIYPKAKCKCFISVQHILWCNHYRHYSFLNNRGENKFF
jgi:hypothetical protein